MLIRYINKVTVHSNYESTIYKLYLLMLLLTDSYVLKEQLGI